MNILELNKLIESVALTVPNVNSYSGDDVYEVWNTTEIKYGSMSFNLQTTSQTNNTRTFIGVLYYADRLTEDKSNRLQVYADADNAISNVLTFLADNSEDQISIADYQITHFQQKFADYLAGGYATVNITVGNTCDIVLLQSKITESK